MEKYLIPKGFFFTGIACGIAKKKRKRDLGIIFSDVPAHTAAVFTTNRVKAAPVLLSIKNVKKGLIQAIVANSGNANACTGRQGLQDSRETADLVAAGLGIKQGNVMVASTGVIGVPLPMEKVRKGIEEVISGKCLGSTLQHLSAFSQAIMTTDTRPKVVSLQERFAGKTVTITGVAKGSGMIHPQLATMLVFIVTDAAVGQDFLRVSLKRTVEKSFHMLTVDGDTSTNDLVVLMANGKAENTLIKNGRNSQIFQRHLDKICIELAKMIARDGEGASKSVQICVRGGRSFSAAKQAAMSIAKSNLVKTALYGNDPNWGRIIAAVGYSGVEINPEIIDIVLEAKGAQIPVCISGKDPGFDETKARAIMQHKEIVITVNLHQGRAEATVFTCDLTPKYIAINANYRT